jgi:hypothetical protein
MVDQALVVHLFAPAGGSEGRAQLRRILQRCSEVLGMTEPIPGIAPYDLPRQVSVARGPAVAARQVPLQGSTDGIVQAIVRKSHDVLALSVVLAPASTDATADWPLLEARWIDLVGPSDGWALGEARLLTAVAESEPPTLAIDGSFTPAHEVGDHTLLWEEKGVDTRALRRIVAVARVGREHESDAWLWGRGDAAFPPFEIYLLHTAKLRHQLRVRDAAEPTVSAALDLTDDLLRQRYEPLPGDPAASLVAIRGRFSRLLAGPGGLTPLATSLREMKRTVEIATANTQLVATVSEATEGVDEPKGLVGDDLAVAQWFAQRLDDDLVYVEAARRRVRDGLTEVVQAAEEAIQSRRESLARAQERTLRERERFDLLQTAVIGAVLMVLAATQSFGYRVPLAGSVIPAVIALLGSLVLVLAAAAVTVRTTPDESRWAEVVVGIVAGLTAAALSWVATAVAVRARSGTAASSLLTVGLAVPSFAVGVILTRRWRVRRRVTGRGE